jgi:hypothetical protein
MGKWNKKRLWMKQRWAKMSEEERKSFVEKLRISRIEAKKANKNKKPVGLLYKFPEPISLTGTSKKVIITITME